MTLLIHKPVNLSRNKNRIWLEGKHLLNYFCVGDKLEVRDDLDGDSFSISKVTDITSASKNSIRTVSRKVSRHGDGVSALIEINETNSDNLRKFKPKQLVYIKIEKGVIRVSIDKSSLESRIEERVTRLKYRLQNAIPLEKADIFCGGGTGSLKAHEGLKLAGIPSIVRYALDNYDQAIENIAANCRHLFGSQSEVLNSDITQLDISRFKQVDIISITSSCVDSSVAGRAKKGNCRETNKTVNLVYFYSKIFEQVNAAVLFFENVTGILRSGSWHLFESLLTLFGYKLHVRKMNSHKEGFSIESRDRVYVVAVTEGLDLDFDLDKVKPLQKPLSYLSSFLQDVPNDSDVWKPFKHLKQKMIRDKEKGNSFAMQIFHPKSTKISCLRAAYKKLGSSDPLIAHPTNPNLYRPLTEQEHCLIKELPLSFIRNCVSTHAHMILGNGIIGSISKAIFFEIGKSLSRYMAKQPEVLAYSLLNVA